MKYLNYIGAVLTAASLVASSVGVVWAFLNMHFGLIATFSVFTILFGYQSYRDYHSFFKSQK
jgi:hypothetical protein